MVPQWLDDYFPEGSVADGLATSDGTSPFKRICRNIDSFICGCMPIVRSCVWVVGWVKHPYLGIPETVRSRLNSYMMFNRAAVSLCVDIART